MIDKRDLLKGAAAAAVITAFGLPTSGHAQSWHYGGKPKRPDGPGWNLLWITVDDMDASMPGFMSGRKGLTPNLDALAASSHRFVNNRTVAPICMPAREAFMTGRLPWHSGAVGFVPIHEGIPTLTTILASQHYYTGGIHKLEHMQPHSCFPWDYAQGGSNRSTVIHARGLKMAMEQAAGQRKPFFVQCNINDPHRPFYGAKWAEGKDHHETGDYAIPHPLGPDDVTVPPWLDDLPDVRLELSQYWNSVQRMDITIGDILKTLRESGQEANTMVVFCADHGMPFPFAKATCYDHGTRVPVLLRYPGMDKPRTFDNLTTNIDILPTLLDLLEIPAPDGLDGRSWMPIIKGKATEEPEFQFTTVDHVASGMAYPMRAIQDRRYVLLFSPWSDGKLVMHYESLIGLTFPAMVRAARTDPEIAARVKQVAKGIPLAFYDLQEDPGQRRNLLGEKRHAARITRMKNAMLAEMKRTGDPELANFRRQLAGRQPVVPQDREKYRQAKHV